MQVVLDKKEKEELVAKLYQDGNLYGTLPNKHITLLEVSAKLLDD